MADAIQYKPISGLNETSLNKIIEMSGKELAEKSYVDAAVSNVTVDTTNLATKSELEAKVNKVEGKGLSTEDFTTEYKNKLEGLNNTGASDEQISTAVNNYLTEHPVSSGATAEQAAQIETNTNDITNLKSKISDIPIKITKSEYNALSENEKTGKVFMIIDEPEEEYSLSYSNNTLKLLKGSKIISTVTITSSTQTPTETYGEIILSKESSTIIKGNKDTFTVCLDKAPTNEQIISLTSNSMDVTLSTETLTFTSDNYNVPQSVEITVASSTTLTNANISLTSSNVISKSVVITISESTSTSISYTITNNLTNVVNSNTASSIEENSSYSATLTPDTGYELGEVRIIMGENDITSTAYSNGSISITNVTENVVINAIATKIPIKTEGTTLMHSYNLASVNAAEDGTYPDLTGSWNLNSSKKVGRDETTLIGRLDSFSIKLYDFTYTSQYQQSILNTGQMDGFNVTSHTVANGRILIKRDISYGNATGSIILKYYDIDTGELHDNVETSGNIPLNSQPVLILTSDAENNETKLYIDGILVHTLNQQSALCGLVFEGYGGKVEIYSGVLKVGE